ncbi:hypothetical protein IRJ41_021234 [Triplophysa rosa]|uniref:Uncharacterized protein n=1 Tax=Triplophysa rosa TaxID=992332 RepID=A0A9W7TKC6_TRIRA|nr:hypothetical protein IRJ41_021234 [Triplophysa rosa]
MNAAQIPSLSTAVTLVKMLPQQISPAAQCIIKQFSAGFQRTTDAGTHYLPLMFSRCGVCHKIRFISPAFPNPTLEEGSSGTERIAQAIGPASRHVTPGLQSQRSRPRLNEVNITSYEHHKQIYVRCCLRLGS